MNPGTEMRKPLRARKTMALSSRKQVEHLSKMKSGEAAAGPKRPAELRPGAQQELRSTSSSSSSETPAGQKPLPPKEPLAGLLVNSEISIYKDPQKILQALPNPDIQRFLNGGTLQDILSYWYTKESGSPLLEPVKVSLQSGPAGQLPDQLPVASSVHKNTATDAAAESPVGQTFPALPPQESRFGVPERDGAPAVPLGEGQRKRTASSNGEEDHVLSKRSKAYGDSTEGTSPAMEEAESGLGKVQCLIRSQLEASMRELDQGLRHLNERIDRTQCLRKHEGIAIKIVKKISRLDRHINAVISFQRKKVLSQKVKQPRTHAQSKVLNGATLPPNTNVVGKPVPPKKPTSTEILSSTAERSSGAEVVPCVEASKPSLGVLAAPAPPPKAAAGYPDLPGDQDASVIDLTDEENNPDKEEKKKVAGSRHLGQESRLESLPQPARDSPDQVPPRFPHLPPLPSVEPDPAPWKDLGDTPLPQKLELVVAQVNQPKGFALQWNISHVDPRCAPIESFSLFICLEDISNGTTSEWKRTSVIKALPLPMACSLSQFPRSVKCYFTMRSKDVHGRHGPFCEVQSISAL